MSNQIFKRQIPNETLFQLLNNICMKNEKHYTFNNDSFKKGIYNSDIEHFIQLCSPYYFISKRKKYLEKKLTFNTFSTVLRQICNFNKIIYTSQIKYTNSSYYIEYYIYY